LIFKKDWLGLFNGRKKIMVNRITAKDIEKILGFKIGSDLKDQVDKFNLVYRELSSQERDKYISTVIDVLFNDIVYSGKHRINDWEKGWSENLRAFKSTKDIGKLVPRYHGKYRIVRWNKRLIYPLIDSFDYKIHICMVDAILQHYLKNCSSIYEFGCGPAYHLLRLNKFNNKINLYGSDWTKSSQNIIKKINKIMGTNIKYFNFDFFSPDYKIPIEKNSGIYTVAALEQVGVNFKPFIEYLMEKKPAICVHMEPIDELLDPNRLIDKLSILYFRKRNYLSGFLPYLEQLEKKKKIEIIKKQRIYTGSYFIEGHSLIVWKFCTS